MPMIGFPRHHRRLGGAPKRSNQRAAPSDREAGGTISNVVRENIEELVESRHASEQAKGRQAHIADFITRFCGSMLFVYVHAVWFVLWTAMNVGWLGLPIFDEFPFGLLTMIVSLEAVFLSTFVLISQNRLGGMADKRADLDLQINLLAEHEVTEILVMLHAITAHLGLEEATPDKLDDLTEHVSAGQVLDEMARQDDQPVPQKD